MKRKAVYPGAIFAVLCLAAFAGCADDSSDGNANDSGARDTHDGGNEQGERDASDANPDDRFVERVDVGGYSLFIACAGAGSPTVVMETGFSDGGGVWPRQVIDGVAEVSRVCVYDRAGLGFSDDRPDITHSGKVSTDLHALLTGAGIVAPLVLVGHSLGGMHVRVYAHDHPEDVVGIVLIDSSHPDQQTRARERLPASDWASMERSLKAVFSDPTKEPLDWNRSAKLARSAGSLGDRPLAVLSHDSAVPQCQGGGCLSAEGQMIWEDLWQELQAELATLSSHSTHVVSRGSRHYIQEDDPELVVESISHVVDAVR